MEANLTPVKKIKTFDEYWNSRTNPGAADAWETALNECEECYRKSLEEMISAMDIAVSELERLSPGNRIAGFLRQKMKDQKPGEG